MPISATILVGPGSTEVNYRHGSIRGVDSLSEPASLAFDVVQPVTDDVLSIGEEIRLYDTDGVDAFLRFRGTIDEVETEQIDETLEHLVIQYKCKGMDLRLFRRYTWEDARVDPDHEESAQPLQFKSYAGWCNVSGSTVTWVDGTTVEQETVGDRFSLEMLKYDATIIIDGNSYPIASVDSPTQLTITGTASEAGAPYDVPVYSGTAIKYILDNVCDGEGATYDNTTIQQGARLENIVFDPPVTAYDAINDIVKLNPGWYFRGFVGVGSVCYFQPWDTVPAPSDWTDVIGAAAYKRNIHVNRSRVDVRNSEISQFDLIGASRIDHTITGDGETSSWFLPRKILKLIAVLLNGVDVTDKVRQWTGTEEVEADYYFIERDWLFWQSSLAAEAAPLQSTDELLVQFYEVGGNYGRVDDWDAVADRQATEGGGSGLYEMYIDRTRFKSWVDAMADAESSIERLKNDTAEGVGVTRQVGYFPGQSFTLNLASNKVNEDLIIERVEYTDANAEYSGFLWYTISTISVSRWLAENDVLRSLFDPSRGTGSPGGGGGGSAAAPVTGSQGVDWDKATWNLGVGGPVTPVNIARCVYVEVRLSGTVYECLSNCRYPGPGTVTFEIWRSRDSGATWVSLFGATKIVLTSAGSAVPRNKVTVFATPPNNRVQVDDLLKITMATGSNLTWELVDVVLKWRRSNDSTGVIGGGGTNPGASLPQPGGFTGGGGNQTFEATGGDDTAAIQALIDGLSSGETLFISGIAEVTALNVTSKTNIAIRGLDGTSGLLPTSNTTGQGFNSLLYLDTCTDVLIADLIIDCENRPVEPIFMEDCTDTSIWHNHISNVAKDDAGPPFAAIHSYNGLRITVQENTVENTQGTISGGAVRGIWLGSGASDYDTDSIIRANVVRNTGHTGIIYDGQGATIEDNVVEDSLVQGTGIKLIIRGTASEANVTGNTINGTVGAGIMCEASDPSPEFINITDNNFINCGEEATTFGAFYCSGERTINVNFSNNSLNACRSIGAARDAEELTFTNNTCINMSGDDILYLEDDVQHVVMTNSGTADIGTNISDVVVDGVVIVP